MPAAQAAVMGATQRPATEAALSEPLPTHAPASRHVPSWFVFGDQDMNIPVALHRFMAERAGDDAQELIGSVTDDRMLEVTTVATDPDRRHPLMGSDVGGAYDRFRAVHDVLGHARLGLG